MWNNAKIYSKFTHFHSLIGNQRKWKARTKYKFEKWKGNSRKFKQFNEWRRIIEWWTMWRVSWMENEWERSMAMGGSVKRSTDDQCRRRRRGWMNGNNEETASENLEVKGDFGDSEDNGLMLGKPWRKGPLGRLPSLPPIHYPPGDGASHCVWLKMNESAEMREEMDRQWMGDFPSFPFTFWIWH